MPDEPPQNWTVLRNAFVILREMRMGELTPRLLLAVPCLARSSQAQGP